jgi:hypothetical protein
VKTVGESGMKAEDDKQEHEEQYIQKIHNKQIQYVQDV